MKGRTLTRSEKMKKQTIAVLGPGSWGTALSQVPNDNGHEVRIWEIFLTKLMKSITNIQTNAGQRYPFTDEKLKLIMT